MVPPHMRSSVLSWAALRNGNLLSFCLRWSAWRMATVLYGFTALTLTLSIMAAASEISTERWSLTATLFSGHVRVI